MSKYKKYPQYKDSGVEWLGEIPNTWTANKIKNICYINDGNHGEEYPSEKDYTDAEIGVPFIRAGNIQKLKVTSKDMLYITKEKNASMRKGNLQHMDILFTNRGEIGKVAIIGKEFIGSNLNSQIAYVRPDNSLVNGKYLAYSLISDTVRYMKDSLSAGSVLTQFPIRDLSNIPVVYPPVQAQQTIANYLDKATVKIDTLIEKQTKLIELLKEKRQAVISTAVTRGLDSLVPMKDSGVEWLGEIPEHWTRIPLRYIGRLQNGISKGGDYFGAGFSFVNYGDIYKNATLPQEVLGLAKSTKEDQHIYSVKTGDVFFTRTSETIDDIGMASTCIKTIEKGTFSGFTIRFRQLAQTLNEHFSKYYFRTGHSQAFFEEQLNLVTRASLGQDILKQLPVLLPPLEEQQVIADYLDDKTSKIDILISKATKAIKLLKERRTALISAVVTGKIDVRESI